MSEERYSLGGFWGPRQESVDDCARRAAECFRQLALCDECFVHWVKPGTGRRKPGTEFEPSLDALRHILAKRRNRSDVTGSVIEDLGFPGVLSNGYGYDDWVTVDYALGAYSDELDIPNRFLIELPFAGEPSERVLRVDKLCTIMRAVTQSWDPDWGRALSVQQFDLVPMPGERTPDMVGWLTYFSDRYGPLPDLPAEYEVRRLEGGNLIAIKTEGRFTVSNPEHIEAARRLVAILHEADKLLPTPDWHRRQPERARRRALENRSQGQENSGQEASPGGLTLQLSYPPTPENAPRFAAEIVDAAKKIDKVDLDYSVASLERVDAILDKFHRTGGAPPETKFIFGCYVGQVFVAQAGGKWCSPNEGPFAGTWPMIQLPGGMLVNPISKVFKRVENGAEDELTYFYHVFARHD